MRQSSSSASNQARLARSDSASSSQCFNLTRWILGGAIFVYAVSIIVWQHKTLNIRYGATSLEDTFPHFVRETSPGNPKINAPVGKEGSRYENEMYDVMQHYRTPAQILQSPQLPDWVKQYTEWHAKQRKRYLDAIRNNSTPPEDIHFLISRCLSGDKCGGASDRLQDMPYNFMLANQTNRVLLIKWDKPARLEHYLVPPEGGINWTISDDMFQAGDNWHLRGKETGNDRIVSTIRRDSAAPIFRKYEVEDLGHKIYHEIFRLLFRPSDDLAIRVTKTMNDLDLIPSMYSSIHLRMKYPASGINEKTFSFERFKDKIVGWAKNAVNCAAELHPNSTAFYVTADNNDTVGYLLQDSPFAKHYSDAIANSREPLVKLVARDYSSEVEHVAFSSTKEADGFMNVFEDMMILGLGKCVAHGLGGYGRLGAALSGGVCATAHRGKYSKTCVDVLEKAPGAAAFDTGTFKKISKVQNNLRASND